MVEMQKCGVKLVRIEVNLRASNRVRQILKGCRKGGASELVGKEFGVVVRKPGFANGCARFQRKYHSESNRV